MTLHLGRSELITAALEYTLATTPEKLKAWADKWAQDVLAMCDDQAGEIAKLEADIEDYEDYPDLDELEKAVNDQIILLRGVAKALKEGSHSPNHLLGDVAAIGRELVVIKDKIKPPEA